MISGLSFAADLEQRAGENKAGEHLSSEGHGRDLPGNCLAEVSASANAFQQDVSEIDGQQGDFIEVGEEAL